MSALKYYKVVVDGTVTRVSGFSELEAVKFTVKPIVVPAAYHLEGAIAWLKTNHSKTVSVVDITDADNWS